jgi:hypothetical protein
MEMGMIYTLETFMYAQGTKKEEIKSQVQEVFFDLLYHILCFSLFPIPKFPKQKSMPLCHVVTQYHCKVSILVDS